MVRRKGRVAVDSTIAYVTQQAWIMNRTLQENIVFGHTFIHIS